MKKCSVCRGSTFFKNETDKINYQLTRVISQSFTFFETIKVAKIYWLFTSPTRQQEYQ